MIGPTVVVYCEGPPDWTHECFVVACYRQHLAGDTLCGYRSPGGNTAAGAAWHAPCSNSTARTAPTS
jgi:hypothetical protein